LRRVETAAGFFGPTTQKKRDSKAELSRSVEAKRKRRSAAFCAKDGEGKEGEERHKDVSRSVTGKEKKKRTKASANWKIDVFPRSW